MLFFGPKWMSRNEQKAVPAVEKIDSQEELFRVATKARLSTARIAAITRLKDLELLILVRETDSPPNVHMAAYQQQKAVIREICDDQYLAEAAERMPDMRMQIADQVADPIAYAKVLKCINFTVKDSLERGNATKKAEELAAKLEDQQLLFDVALHAKDKILCRAAAGKLTDIELRREYVAHSDDIHFKNKLCPHDWKPAISKTEKDPCRKCVYCGDSLRDHEWTGVDAKCEERCVTCGAVRETHLFADWRMIPGSYKTGNSSSHDSGGDTWRESATCTRCGAVGERDVAE